MEDAIEQALPDIVPLAMPSVIKGIPQTQVVSNFPHLLRKIAQVVQSLHTTRVPNYS